MPILYAGNTDVGCKRAVNQDSIFMDGKLKFFVVADGMGGHKGGDVASQIAVKELSEYVKANSKNDPEDNLQKSVTHTNKTILQKGNKNPLWKGMGTTVVEFYFKSTKLYIANVGDSRGYLISQKKLYQLTKDHSLIQEKINFGMYTREQAHKDPQKNVLSRTVGFDKVVQADVFNYKVQKNDIFLLCSDGLHGMVSDEDILYLINKFIPEPSKSTPDDLSLAADALVEQANVNGGEDNISVILIITQ
ncbi:MAG: Stp1/IreP family PP2C-type Ser/Thr phosphatase [Epsilonproteobacteria bacterium]|nr:MAG: Stp1/IreP family PP2C-type Ser/Thr phosphatase [Campylobacterota bacterium]RLA67126.1 MAG: Stp1/IreP family PP2C-type Ser/Thr phosphatase [Campylobacterota bacterium]